MLSLLVTSTLLMFLLFIEPIHAAVYITLPSAVNGCGSLLQDSYFWDEMNDPNRTSNEPMNFYDSFMTVPKGTYYFYRRPDDPNFYPSDIQQYFCTGLVDEMPVGSYCFYQNPQNCSFSFFFFILHSFQNCFEWFDH